MDDAEASMVSALLVETSQHRHINKMLEPFGLCTLDADSQLQPRALRDVLTEDLQKRGFTLMQINEQLNPDAGSIVPFDDKELLRLVANTFQVRICLVPVNEAGAGTPRVVVVDSNKGKDETNEDADIWLVLVYDEYGARHYKNTRARAAQGSMMNLTLQANQLAFTLDDEWQIDIPGVVRDLRNHKDVSALKKRGWRYVGGNSGDHLNTFKRIKLNEEIPPLPPVTDSCLCGHPIKDQCYLLSPTGNIILVIGNHCVIKFTENGHSRTCSKCGEKTRCKNVHNLCKDCFPASEKCMFCNKPRVSKSVNRCRACKSYGPIVDTVECPRCRLLVCVRESQKGVPVEALCTSSLCVALWKCRLVARQVLETVTQDDFLWPTCAKEKCHAKIQPDIHRLLLEYGAKPWCSNCVGFVAHWDCRFGRHKGCDWATIVHKAKSYCHWVLRDDVTHSLVLRCYLVHTVSPPTRPRANAASSSS